MGIEFNADEFVRALERVSNDIKREVGSMPIDAANQMAGLLESRYPVGKKHYDPAVPHMRDDIRIRTLIGREYLLQARRVVGPRLGYIWQDGTRERFDHVHKGARRGRMPAADPKFFERTAAKVRADMLARAQDVLDRPREID